MFLKPISRSRFAGYSLGFAQGVIVSFDVDDKSIATQLIIDGKDEKIIAHRVKT